MLPEEFKERMKGLLGEEYPVFEQYLEGEPCGALRVNTGKIPVEEFLRIAPFGLRQVPWTDSGFYYDKTEERPGRHPFHEAGLYYIQEPSAMAPASFLRPMSGERVLDLCAAPGGKTTQLGEAMRGRGVLVSNEIHPARARILSENVERMGLVNTIVTNETPEKLAEFFPAYFDKILVDAPCSGEGMFRKNEEAAREWSAENVRFCAARQDGILDAAAVMLRTGGRLLYSTCTFAPEEDEGSISRFLRRHPEFLILRPEAPEGFLPGRPDWIDDPVPGLEHTLRIMPHRAEGEGHYMALLQKGNNCGEGTEENGKAMGQSRGGCPEELAAFRTENLLEFSFSGAFLKFGEQLYLTPPAVPSLKGLKVLRPGLHVGTLKKNRLEPSHALALALRPEQVRLWARLRPESAAAARFLNGQTLTPQEVELHGCGPDGKPRAVTEKDKGWCLVCLGEDGPDAYSQAAYSPAAYSLGWGRLSGGIIKNHYPKGLRKG